MEKMMEMRIHGYGGQGVVTLAQLVASAGLNAGYETQSLPFFGVERRGSAVKAGVRIDENKIRIRSQSIEPDYLVMMNETLLDLALSEGIADDGGIIMNTSNPRDLGRTLYYLDATGIAIENELMANDSPFINIPMFGAVCKIAGLPKEAIIETLTKRWPGKVGEKNAKVALIGYDLVKEYK